MNKKIFKMFLASIVCWFTAGVAIAQPDFNNADAVVVNETAAVTGKGNVNTNTWYLLKTGNYYLYYNNGWAVTNTLPSNDAAASSWSNYLFYIDEDGYVTTQSGRAVKINTSGNVSTSGNNATYGNDGKISGIRILTTYYLRVNNGSLSGNNNQNNAAVWTAVPVSFTKRQAQSFTIGDLTYTVTTNATQARPGEVSVKLSNYSATDVTVPSKVVNDTYTYNVTAVDNYGFTDNSTNYPGYYSSCTNNQAGSLYRYITHYNPTLKSVTFESPCQITKIGNQAFEGCTALTEVTVPNSVETLGTAVFRGCSGLKTVKFQTDNQMEVKIKEIPNETFRWCTGMTSLELPSGIQAIGDQAIMYCFELRSLQLPNTLKTIGTHFVCDCSSLVTLTIPASVTYINGAAFHGCESLQTVYLLGDASALDASDSSGNDTFGANSTYCKGRVTGCTFYTTQDYANKYLGDNVWKQLYHENNDVDNDISWEIPGTKRDFTAGKWVTVCFPKVTEEFSIYAGSEDIEASYYAKMVEAFGADFKIAEMVSASYTESDNMYHTTYKVIPHSDITNMTPYLICPSKDGSFTFWDALDEENPDFKLAMTNAYPTWKTAPEDGAIVRMVGNIAPIDNLQPEWFIFKSSGNATGNLGSFNMVPTTGKTVVKLGACRAYWRVDRQGVRTAAAMGARAMTFDDEEATGIKGVQDVKVVLDGIYDLNGRRLNVTREQLPEGLYIINGNKTVVK